MHHYIINNYDINSKFPFKYKDLILKKLKENFKIITFKKSNTN